MTILWIYDMPLDPEAGGTERITSLVAKGLSKRGYNCMDILVFDEKSKTMTYKGHPVNDLYDFLKDNHVDVVINQIAYSKWLLSDFLALGGGRWHSEGGKIISCLHFDPCNPSALHLAKCNNDGSLQSILNIAKATLLHNLYEKRRRKYEGETYNYVYDNSDYFVILSDTHRDYLKDVMGRDEMAKLYTINNPLTFDSIATKDSLEKKEKVMLVCSRMSEFHKRISLVLKAWKMLNDKGPSKDWRLKIVGDGPDLNMYKAFVDANGLTNVEFCGKQNPLPYYQEASILLQTSSAEGWGLSLTEALQNGVVPIVMDSSPVYRDIIDSGHNGYLTPNGNIKLFSEYCRTLIDDPQRRYTMQCNALDSAKRFDIQNSMERWEQILTTSNQIGR